MNTHIRDMEGSYSPLDDSKLIESHPRGDNASGALRGIVKKVVAKNRVVSTIKQAQATGYKQRISIRKDVSLNPCMKWKKYKRVPWKLFTHLLLLLLITARVLIINVVENSYIRRSRATWIALFYPSNYTATLRDPLDFPNNDQYFLPSNALFKSDVQRVVCTLYTLEDVTLEPFRAGKNPSNPPPGIVAEQFVKVDISSIDKAFLDKHKGILTTYFNYYNVQKEIEIARGGNCSDISPVDTWTPFDIAQMLNVQLKMKVISTALSPTQRFTMGATCIEWQVIMNYDLSRGGQILVSTDSHCIPCAKSKTSDLINFPNLLDLLIAIVSLTYHVLLVRRIIKRWNIFKTVISYYHSTPVFKKKIVRFSPATGLASGAMVGIQETLSPRNNSAVVGTRPRSSSLGNSPRSLSLAPAAGASTSSLSVEGRKKSPMLNSTDTKRASNLSASHITASTSGAVLSKKIGVKKESKGSPARRQSLHDGLSVSSASSDSSIGSAKKLKHVSSASTAGQHFHHRTMVASAPGSATISTGRVITGVKAKLRFKDKLYLFPTWTVITAVGCLCNFLHSFLQILNRVKGVGEGIDDYFFTMDNVVFVFGYGVLIMWLSVIQFFVFNFVYYRIVEIIFKSLRRLIRLAVAAVPIFVAYIVVGSTYFGARSYGFSTYSQASVSLFAFMNGDSMRQTFHQVTEYNGDLQPFAHIYLVSFVFIFTYLVLSVILAVIEETFFLKTNAEETGNGPSNGSDSGGGGASDTTPATRDSSKSPSEVKSKQPLSRLGALERQASKGWRSTRRMPRYLHKLFKDMKRRERNARSAGLRSAQSDTSALIAPSITAVPPPDTYLGVIEDISIPVSVSPTAKAETRTEAVEDPGSTLASVVVSIAVEDPTVHALLLSSAISSTSPELVKSDTLSDSSSSGASVTDGESSAEDEAP